MDAVLTPRHTPASVSGSISDRAVFLFVQKTSKDATPLLCPVFQINFTLFNDRRHKKLSIISKHLGHYTRVQLWLLTSLSNHSVGSQSDDKR